MKIQIFSITLITTLFITLFGCNSTKSSIIDYNYSKSPIIDYNKDSYNNINFTSTLKKKQNEQTVVLINNKVKSLDIFDSHIKKNKIKTFKVINDRNEIEKLGYSYEKIKTIIIAQK